jgi:hypothetical protein
VAPRRKVREVMCFGDRIGGKVKGTKRHPTDTAAQKLDERSARDKSYLGQPRFSKIRIRLMVQDRSQYPDRGSFERRLSPSSASSGAPEVPGASNLAAKPQAGIPTSSCKFFSSRERYPGLRAVETATGRGIGWGLTRGAGAFDTHDSPPSKRLRRSDFPALGVANRVSIGPGWLGVRDSRAPIGYSSLVNSVSISASP